MRVQDPGIPQPRGAAHGGVAVRADPHRQPGLDGQQRELCFAERVARRAGRDRLARQQPPHHVEVVGEAPHALVTLDREGVELLVAVPEPDAQPHPTAADDVQRGNLLGHVDRVQQPEQQDARRQAHVARLARQAPQQRDRLQHLEGTGQVVLGNGDRAEAHLARQAHLVDEVLDPPRHVLAGRVLGADFDPEVHASQCTLSLPS